MAFGDPGGPGGMGGYSSGGGFGASVDTGGTRGGSSSGRGGGGYSSGFGSQVDTGGTRGGTSGGGGTSFGNEVATEGAGKGYGAGHNSTGGAGDSSAPASRAQQATQTRAQARKTGVYGELDTSMDSVTNGAIASFDDADTISPEAHTSAMQVAGLPDSIQANASPGLVGHVMALAAGVMGSPVAGLAVDTGMRARAASQEIGAINDAFGTSLDDSFGNSLGQQTAGALGGLIGSRGLGQVGATLGRSLGVPGQIGGMMAGSMVGKSLGRSVAMDAFNGGGSMPSDGSPAGGDGGYSPDPGATMMAGTTPQQAGQPAAAPAASADYGPVDFNGYASYAQSFFA